MLLHMALFQYFLWLSNILLYTGTTSSSSMLGGLDCFHVLAVVNSATMNTGVQVSFQIRVFIFSGYMPRDGIAGSYCSSTFTFFFFF